MADLERFACMLDEQAALLPREVFQDLNLGVGVVEHAKADRHAQPGRPLYVLGEYRVHPVMGRGVLLYYGSFQKVYPGLAEDALRQEIDRVLKHELTHHLEHRAGSRDLEIADAQRLMRWQEEDSL